jgi:hypothetical protein
MTGDGLEPVDLTGRWVGFYRYRWEQLGSYPIVANLTQTGRRITGEMFDQITDRSDYLETLRDVLGKDMSVQQRITLGVMIRRFGSDAVVNVRLPDTSDIEGRIKGSQVQFTKAYRGTLDASWAVGEKQVLSYKRYGHKVHYSGHLDLEPMCIAGRWMITYGRFLDWILPPRDFGSFELYRKS